MELVNKINSTMQYAKEDEDKIQDYLDSINDSIEKLRKDSKELNDADIPSNFKIMMGGLSGTNSKLLQLIFDLRIDKTIDKVLDDLMSGDMSDIDRYLNTISSILEKLGLGKNAFSGPISQLLMNNIMNSLNSIDFNKTSNKVKKVMLILKNLRKQAKVIKDKELKKKYIDAVYALKKVAKFISRLYKDRAIITDRVKRGLHNAINEDIKQTQEVSVMSATMKDLQPLLDEFFANSKMSDIDKKTYMNKLKIEDYKIIYKDSAPIGFYCLNKENGRTLKQLFISEKYRNKGIGSSVLKDIAGKENLFIGTDVGDDRTTKFYIKNGFKKIGPNSFEKSSEYSYSNKIHENIIVDNVEDLLPLI